MSNWTDLSAGARSVLTEMANVWGESFFESLGKRVRTVRRYNLAKVVVKAVLSSVLSVEGRKKWVIYL